MRCLLTHTLRTFFVSISISVTIFVFHKLAFGCVAHPLLFAAVKPVLLRIFQLKVFFALIERNQKQFLALSSPAKREKVEFKNLMRHKSHPRCRITNIDWGRQARNEIKVKVKFMKETETETGLDIIALYPAQIIFYDFSSSLNFLCQHKANQSKISSLTCYTWRCSRC